MGLLLPPKCNLVSYYANAIKMYAIKIEQPQFRLVDFSHEDMHLYFPQVIFPTR